MKIEEWEKETGGERREDEEQREREAKDRGEKERRRKMKPRQKFWLFTLKSKPQSMSKHEKQHVVVK